MEKQKIGALSLIKQFFGMSLDQMKEERSKLTQQDILQLGSAIARERGIAQEDLSFELISY